MSTLMPLCRKKYGDAPGKLQERDGQRIDMHLRREFEDNLALVHGHIPHDPRGWDPLTADGGRQDKGALAVRRAVTGTRSDDKGQEKGYILTHGTIDQWQRQGDPSPCRR